MTNEETITTLNMVEAHGSLVVQAKDIAIKALEQEPCEYAISRQAAIDAINKIHPVDTEYDCTLYDKLDVMYMLKDLPSVTPQPKTGHWSRKTKVDAYDIAGVKTWGIKCQCDKCDFTTIVVEDFGYYKYCPNCGARMIEPKESEG